MFTPYPTLRKHVLHSNAIENIHTRQGPLVTSHQQAALFAASQQPNAPLLDPLEIHRHLAKGTPMEPFGGTYRTSGVAVGDKQMPHHAHLPMLMQQWFELVEYACAREESMRNKAKSAYILHDWFLCIHPFKDGNGRTARLVLNAIRIKMGLPWKIVLSDEEMHATYLAWINRIESLFKEYNPQVYL